MKARRLPENENNSFLMAILKAPQVSGIDVTNTNWYIVVDQFFKYKKSEFHYTKSNFVELTCRKFSQWKKCKKETTTLTMEG